MTRVLVVFGTRPEGIKMAPVVRRLEAVGIDHEVCVTGQHATMLEPILRFFEIEPSHDLAILERARTLNEIVAATVSGVEEIVQRGDPELVLVHGDTTSAMAAATAAFNCGVPVGHVEAGLRTWDMSQPWPEEMNRQLVDLVSTLLFAPTQRAADNLDVRSSLARERQVLVTGNTVIDALFQTLERIDATPELVAEYRQRFDFIDTDRPLVLVTGHRRESFGEGFANICRALRRLAETTEAQVVYPVHLNPNVREPVMSAIGDATGIHLIEPVDYMPFVYLMRRAQVILTDSGGIQEEAPSLGKPVLVMRNVTERPEAVEAGTVSLVGTDPERIVSEVTRALFQHGGYPRANPYGDGHAAARIGRAIKDFLR